MLAKFCLPILTSQNKASIFGGLMFAMCLVLSNAHSSFGQQPYRNSGGANLLMRSPKMGQPNFAALQTGVPTLSVNDVAANEGDPGVANAVTFTVTLSAPSQAPVSVTVSTQSGTAIGNSDFAAGSLPLTIEPNQTSTVFTVFTIGDSAVEGTEQFFVNLSNPVNATIADGQGVATIVDDDTLLLLTEANSQRAIALDSVLFTRDPLAIRNDLNFSSDQRTRMSLFAIGLKLAQGEPASAVTATAEDSLGVVRPLEVEAVRTVFPFDWFKQVVVKLNDQITVTGDVKIKITLHGATSNTVLVGMKPQ
jgi:hypothetical protein